MNVAQCLTLIVMLISWPALAAVEAPVIQPKSFQSWKDLQVLEAQNQLLRVGAKISQIKSGRSVKADVKDLGTLPSARVKSAADSTPLSLAEMDLKRARESLEAANALELSDYVNIYLPTLESQPEALQSLIHKSSKDELGEILKAILSKNSKIDTKRNPPVIGGLPASPTTTN